MAQKTLARMLRHQMDSKRKDIALVSKRLEQSIEALTLLNQEFEKERDIANKDVSSAVTFSAYLKRIREREQVLLENKIGLENHLKALEEEVIQIFSEAKKYEILLEKSERKEEKYLVESEQKNLDELASTQFIRHQQDA